MLAYTLFVKYFEYDHSRLTNSVCWECLREYRLIRNNGTIETFIALYTTYQINKSYHSGVL